MVHKRRSQGVKLYLNQMPLGTGGSSAVSLQSLNSSHMKSQTVPEIMGHQLGFCTWILEH